jgi:hypothetical protein
MSSTPERRQIIYDSRLPVGEHSNINDPTHPQNIILAAANTEAQASADQRYDINPPPRVKEGFVTYFSFSNKPCFILIHIFILCLLLVAVFHIKQKILKTILAVGIIFILHSIINQFGQQSCKLY